MTATPDTEPATTEQDGGSYDVVIIGAGFSGLGAAYRIAERNPGVRYVVLERRERIGGTWDLFRYPGVRSDSSIFSLSWPWEPWTRKEGVADGDHIREYMEDTARKRGILPHIHFGTHVDSADWDSTTDTWTVHVTENGARKTYKVTGTIKQGISSENAKKITKLIRDDGPKTVKTQIQGDDVRVTSKKRDDLQAVIAMLKSADLDVALQFVNYR